MPGIVISRRIAKMRRSKDIPYVIISTVYAAVLDSTSQRTFLVTIIEATMHAPRWCITLIQDTSELRKRGSCKYMAMKIAVATIMTSPFVVVDADV